MLTMFGRVPAVNLALLLVAAIPAGAVSISVNGSVVFSDGFESGNFSNPTGGAWTFVQTGVTVTSAVSPGPAQGAFYAQMFRDATSGGGSLNGMIGTGPSGITSGDVVLRFMVYIPSASDADARGQFILDSGNRGLGISDFTTARAWIRPNGAGFVETVGAGFGVTTTTVPYATNTWQEWDMEYVVGASTFSFSVNGVTRSGLSSVSSGSVDFVELNNGVASAGSVFVDGGELIPAAGTPEPATLGCGISGLALLLWRFRRSR